MRGRLALVLLVGCGAGPRALGPPAGAPRPLPGDSILVGTTAFVSARPGDPWQGTKVIDAIDVTSGARRWRSDAAEWPLAVSAGVLYAWIWDREAQQPVVVALRATDGALIDAVGTLTLPSWVYHRTWDDKPLAHHDRLFIRGRIRGRELLVSWAVEDFTGGCSPDGRCRSGESLAAAETVYVDLARHRVRGRYADEVQDFVRSWLDLGSNPRRVVDGTRLAVRPDRSIAVWDGRVYGIFHGERVSAEETRRFLRARDAATGALLWDTEIAPQIHDLSASR